MPQEPEFVLLSPHFRLSEFLRSQTATRRGIDMTPPQQVIDNLSRLCVLILEPLRKLHGPIGISSGYRPKALNEIIGGAKNSAHVTGCAADISVAGVSVSALFSSIVAHDSSAAGYFDQVINEYGQWVHVAIAEPGKVPRGQALIAVRNRFGMTEYDVARRV